VGRIPEVIGMSDEMATITKLRPVRGGVLRVRFAGERHERDLDLTGLIARSRHFAPLIDDAATFAKAEIVEDGLGVAWPVQTKWGRLDVSASTLRRIAEEQQPMTGADFAQWRTALGLSLTEAAKLLGVGRRTIMSYVKKRRAAARRRHRLPGALAGDKDVLAAHFVPAREIIRPAA
jgi:hypothetical protein